MPEKLQYHLVWCTKYRYKLLTPEIAEALKKYLLDKQSLWKIAIISVAIEPEHVHMLFSVECSGVDLNKVTKRIKGSTGHFLRRRFSYLQVYPSLWTGSHFLATTGEVSNDTIQQYIDSQGLQEDEIVKRAFVYKVVPATNKGKIKQLKTWLKDPTCRPAGLKQKRQLNKKGVISLRNDLFRIEKSDKPFCDYWLNLPGGNGWKPITVGIQGRELPQDAKICDSQIVFKDEWFWVCICFEQRRIIANQLAPQRVASVDLGISKLITVVHIDNRNMNFYKFAGSEVKKLIFKRRQRLAKLQLLKKKNLSRRLSRYTNGIRDWVHKYTKIIVDGLEKCDVLVVGNIHNITEDWNKDKKQRNKTFRKKAKPVPYGRIMSQLWYKGTLAGTQVVFQNEANTSKRCSRCGELGCRTNEWFVCKQCGYKNQADLNGAINIAKAFQLGLNDKSFVPVCS